MIRLYEEIVGRGGVSPDHFFYAMTMGEAAAFLRGLDAREHAAWERTRWEVWASLKPYSKKLELKDVMGFPWENAGAEADVPDVKEMERLREVARRFEDGCLMDDEG